MKWQLFQWYEYFLTLQGCKSYRVFKNEESPDSIEHRTGEEPGPDSSGTESATENNRPPKVDKGENVR